MVCDSTIWNGNVYTISGTYVDTLQTVHGCDSIVTMDLTINYSVQTTDSLTSCDSVVWNGNTYTTTGTYVDTLQTIHGCDSVVTMDITINNSVATTENTVSCDSVVWNGNVYTISGIFTDTLQTVHGCDSIATLNLTINNSNTGTDSLVACDSTVWNGNVYTTSGMYIDTISNFYGCDSIVTMELTIYNSVNNNDSLVVCDSTIWNGNIYTTTGTYVDTLQTVHGCDSVVTMDLTVNNSRYTNDSLEVCDTALWNGVIYTTSGSYTDTLLTITGCDSIITMDLLVNNSITTVDAQTACNEYTWHGNSYTASGIYVDTLSTINGCDSIIFLNLIVNNSSAIDAGLDTILCSGETISLQAVGNGNIIWNYGVIDNQPFIVDSTRLYVAQLTNSSGCVSTDTVQVTVNQLPNIDAGTDQQICLEDSVQLIASGDETLTWSHPIFTITDSMYVSPSQSTTYYLNNIDSNNCTNSDSITVTVNNLPSISIDSVGPVCSGDSITLVANGGVLYIWSGGVSNNFTFVPDSTTTYFVNVTGVNGCQNSDSITVEINSIPTIDAGSDTVICSSDTVTLTATGSATSFIWNNNITNGVGFIPLASNQYIVIGTDSNSCTNSDTVNVSVTNLSIDAGSDAEICYGESVVLTATGPNPLWSQGVLDGVSFNPDSTLIYTLTISDLNGCLKTDSVLVTVFDLPNVMAPNDTVVCDGDEIQLFASGANNYDWDNGYFNGELFMPDNSGYHIVTGIDSNSCENSDTMYIELMDNPTITYSVNPVVFGNDASIMVTIDGGTPWEDCGNLAPCQEPYLYDWDIDGTGDLDDDLNLFYLNPGNYFLTVYDSLTCRDTATISIGNNFQVFIPTAITPNADGFNDNWVIKGINNFPNASILVFDIQGQVIFQHNNINGSYQPWNGTYLSGQLLLSADYYYQIILDTDNPNPNNTLTGSIMITY